MIIYYLIKKRSHAHYQVSPKWNQVAIPSTRKDTPYVLDYWCIENTAQVNIKICERRKYDNGQKYNLEKSFVC